MTARPLLPSLLFFVLTALSAFGLNSRPEFAHEKSDLKADPAVRFGELPNGLRYAIMANHEPKERASLRLVVMAGSLYETDDQRGLAHFLEHMAFNGSEHYAPGTLVEYFQRHGMNFGGDTNAYTSFDRTVYMLELPDTKPATLAEGFQVFDDYAGSLLLLDKEIDRERGIILSEKRARDSVEYRQFEAEFSFLLPESLISKRLPIGDVPVIEKAARGAFADLYDTWYRPERLAVIAIGDFSPADVEKQIKEVFSGLKPRTALRAEPDLGKTSSFDGLRIKHHRDPEASATSVGIQILTPYSKEPDTAAVRLKHLTRDLAGAMLDRRLAILAKQENAPFTKADVSIHEGFDFYHNAGVDLTCKPEQWAGALRVAEQELRRALEHGFQPAELSEAVANVTNQLEQAVKTSPTRRSDGLADALVDALADGQVFTTPADDLALFQPALAKVTVEQCTAALRESFAAPGRYLTVLGNADIPGDANAAIKAVYEKSAAEKVIAPEKIADASFAYTDFGPAGTVKTDRRVEDLDLHLLTFSNGVRLNYKKTDFEAGKIRVGVRVGTGQLTEPKEKPGLGLLASAIFSAGGLGKHSADDLQRILAGKTVGVGFRVEPDALSFGGATNRDDLLLQLQLVAAYITDPGYRPEAERQARKRFDQLYLQLEHNTAGPLQSEVTRLLASGDKRFGIPPKDDVLVRSIEEVRTWLAPQLAQGAIEISLVGDLDPAAAIDAVAKTVGALPARQSKPALEAERQVAFPAPFNREFTVVTEIPKGQVALYWPTTDSRDIHVTRRLGLLSEVFSDRLRVKIREELGESYSPSAASAPSDTYRNYGLFFTVITVDPAKAQAVVDAVAEIAADLSTNGTTADEVERARKPILTGLRESARTNDYWQRSVLSNAQEMPERLDWCRSRYADFEAITKEDLDALAKKYLPASRAVRVIVRPAKP